MRITQLRPTPIFATGREKWLAHSAMLLFALLISVSFSLGGIATEHASPAAINALRYAVSVAFMAAMIMFVLKRRLTIPKSMWRFGLLGLLMAVYMHSMFAALEITSPVATGAVFTLMPLISAGFALVLLGQKTKTGVLASLVIAATGAIWVIFRGRIDAILAFDVGKGEAIFFIGVVCHAAYAPLIRKFNRGEDAFSFGFWSVVATGLWLMIPGIPALTTTPILYLDPIVWVAIVYLSVVTTVFTFLLLQFAAMRLPAPKVLAYGYLMPTFIIILEGLLGHGWVSLPVVAGALVTACGLLVMAMLPD